MFIWFSCNPSLNTHTGPSWPCKEVGNPHTKSCEPAVMVEQCGELGSLVEPVREPGKEKRNFRDAFLPSGRSVGERTGCGGPLEPIWQTARSLEKTKYETKQPCKLFIYAPYSFHPHLLGLLREFRQEDSNGLYLSSVWTQHPLRSVVPINSFMLSQYLCAVYFLHFW